MTVGTVRALVAGDLRDACAVHAARMVLVAGAATVACVLWVWGTAGAGERWGWWDEPPTAGQEPLTRAAGVGMYALLWGVVPALVLMVRASRALRAEVAARLVLLGGFVALGAVVWGAVAALGTVAPGAVGDDVTARPDLALVVLVVWWMVVHRPVVGLGHRGRVGVVPARGARGGRAPLKS